MARLAIWLSGGFQVKKEGEAVANLGTDKVRALLAYLVVEADRPQRRETLAGLLWPEYGEKRARANLSQALYMLRCALGRAESEQWFECSNRETIQFNGESDYWLDTLVLRNALTTVRAGRTPDEAVRCLIEASTLYAGPFLAGLSLPDCPAFEHWCLLQREQLLGQISRILEQLVAHHEQRGQYEVALVHARRLVALDPWREETQQMIMRLLALSGRRCEAMARYESWRRSLALELNVIPLPATRQLYQALREEKVV